MTSNLNIDAIDKILTNLVDDWQNWLHNGKPGEGRILLIEAKQAIQQELLKARIDELGKFSNGLQMRHYETDIYIDDRIADLQAKLKGDDK